MLESMQGDENAMIDTREINVRLQDRLQAIDNSHSTLGYHVLDTR